VFPVHDVVRSHYEEYPYPQYPLLATVQAADTYALSLPALWAYFNGTLPPPEARKILIAGCGTFAPYPFALANRDTDIVALDLSAKSIRRARLHCRLHGCGKVRFVVGDLTDPAVAGGEFGLIDAYGVLHHLDDPAAGLKALARRLVPGGIMRIMLYSRYARSAEESIRRSLRLLKIHDLAKVRQLLRRAPAGSRMRQFVRTSPEARFDAGVADALLHPCVHTYRIDELLALIDSSGLVPLRFAGIGALADLSSELARLRSMESERRSPGNFVLYLGRNGVAAPPACEGSVVQLNPCLQQCCSLLRWRNLQIAPRFGGESCQLGWDQRRFLRQFRKPVELTSLPEDVRQNVEVYRQALFLLQYVRR